MRRRSRLVAGFQLVETMLAVGFLALVIAVFAQVSVNVARLTSVTTTDATMEQQSRHQLDHFIQDIEDGSAVLATYTGAATYTTDNSTTLVLQAPSYDANGNLLGTNDVTIYYLSGKAAPYSLHRIVITSAGSIRSSSPDTVVASNVQSLSLSYFVSQTYSGDGTTKAFGLSAFPSGPTVTEQATMNGAAVTFGAQPSQAQWVSPSSLTFNTAPASAATINAYYSVDPSKYASSVTQVVVDLALSVSGPTLGHSKTQIVDVAGEANLRNH